MRFWLDVVRIAEQLAERHFRGVVEALPRGALKKGVGIKPHGLLGGFLGQHSGFGRLQHTIQTPQHREGEDDLAVIGLLVIAPEEISDRPDEGGKRLVVQSVQSHDSKNDSQTVGAIGFRRQRQSGSRRLIMEMIRDRQHHLGPLHLADSVIEGFQRQCLQVDPAAGRCAFVPRQLIHKGLLDVCGEQLRRNPMPERVIVELPVVDIYSSAVM